jgi:broad specificity phosphatase PhoE
LDPPLDDTGIKQAELVVSNLADTDLGAVYSSPLSRCLLLANMVVEGRNPDVTIDERLREIDLGEWSGQSHDAVAGRDGETLKRWLEDPASTTLPGGESLLDVRERSMSWLECAVGAHLGKTVLVSSHSTPIKVMLTLMLGLPLNAVHRLSVSLASISKITYDGRSSNLELLNDTCHLRGLLPGNPAGVS